jgi:hypothetical protein
MVFDPDLFDELARCYMRAALDELLDEEKENAGAVARPRPASDDGHQGDEPCDERYSGSPSRGEREHRSAP